MIDSKNLNVFFLPAWYPNPDNKIAGKFVLGHQKAIQDRIKQLSVFYVYPYKDADKLFKQEVSCKDGVNYLIITHKRFGGLLSIIDYFLYSFSLVYGYAKAVKLFGKPDINHVHVLTRIGALALLIKYIYKIPYVVTEHWSRYLPMVNTYKGTLRKKVTRLVAHQSNGISAVSENLLMALKSHEITNHNSCVIKNAIDTAFYKPNAKSTTSTFRFLHVSGLEDKVKNVSGILRVVKELNRMGLAFELHVLGNCSDLEMFKQFVKDNAIPNVFFYGELYGEALLKHYQNADAFVLFSNYENLPCVLLEALCAGLPVISSEVGGTGEIVHPTNGILVKPKDEKGLANAMQYMLINYKEYNQALIRQEAVEKYGFNSVGEQILAFYQQALNQH